MNCYGCGKPIDVKTQGKIELANHNEKTGKDEMLIYHYKPNCSGLIKKKNAI